MSCMKPYIHKVNYYETDKMGITHHSNYVRFMEEARVDFLEQLGWSFDKLEAKGVVSPVLSLDCTFKKSTKFADIIECMVKVEKLSALKLTLAYEFSCGGEVVFNGTSTHCFLDLNGKPVFTEKVYPDFYADLKKCLEE